MIMTPFYHCVSICGLNRLTSSSFNIAIISSAYSDFASHHRTAVTNHFILVTFTEAHCIISMTFLEHFASVSPNQEYKNKLESVFSYLWMSE